MIERNSMRNDSTLISAAVAGCLLENEFFSTGAAKKLTVIGQQSKSLLCAEAAVVDSSFALSQCAESFLSGQWSAVCSGASIVWQ